MSGSDGTELLTEAISRPEALEALGDGPLHRRQLEAALGVSKTTCHRIIRDFDEHGLVRRTDDGYQLSSLGEVVADELDRAARTVGTARELDPLLSALESTDLQLDVSLFDDATITRAQPDDPYPPIRRFMQLLRESNTLRSLDRTSIAPLHVDEIFELVFENRLEVEAIYPRSVVEKLASQYPDYHRRALALDRVTYRAYDDLPFGMSLFDDRVGLRAYDADTGALRLFVDTADPGALVWAETVFETYRERASQPIRTFDSVTESEPRL